MTTLRRSIEIQATPSEVYRSCTNLSELVNLSAIDEITPTPDGRTRWTVRLGTVTRSFVAEVTDRVSERGLSWRNVGGGLRHEASFMIERTERSSTLLVIDWRWEPQGVEELAAAALGADEHAVRRSLSELKTCLERDIA